MQKYGRVNVTLSERMAKELDAIIFIHKTTKKEYIEKALKEYISKNEDKEQIDAIIKLLEG